jgi:pimeloyl-ACP methyl ester carboxylesterase
VKANERYAIAKSTSVAVLEISSLVGQLHRRFVGRVRKSKVSRLPGASPLVTTVDGGATILGKGMHAMAWLGSDVVAPTLLVTASPSAPLLSEGPRGSAVLAAFGAAFGDHLHGSSHTAALAPPMSLRHNGRSVSVTEFSDTQPEPKPNLAIYLHGLGCTEKHWGAETISAVTEGGFTPLYPRYNSGLPIGQNGAIFAGMLEQIVADWPVPVERIILVGHSMGGLVSRSACEKLAGSKVLPLITHVITLGSPHGGSPIEKIADHFLRKLAARPGTAAIARFGNLRSAGIKDLRHGAIRPEDWGGLHPDDAVEDTTNNVPLPTHIQHRAMVAAVSANPDSLLAWLIGDGVVRMSSARPHREMLAGESADVTVVSGTSHLALLSHPTVTKTLKQIAGGRQTTPE